MMGVVGLYPRSRRRIRMSMPVLNGKAVADSERNWLTVLLWMAFF